MIISATSKQFLPSAAYSHSMLCFFLRQAFPINFFSCQHANWMIKAIPLEKLRFFCVGEQNFVFYPSPFNQSCLQPGQTNNCTTASKDMANKQLGRAIWKRNFLSCFLFFFSISAQPDEHPALHLFSAHGRVEGRIQANACIP